MNEQPIELPEEDRYFIFQLGGELYATPLLGVREVIQFQEVKPVPNTRPYFLGMINIRGQIIGVIDLRMKFNHPAQSNATNALIILDTTRGTVAAVVDKIEAVHCLRQSDIDKWKANTSGQEISGQYLIGMGHFNDRLVTVLDLNTALAAEDVCMSR